MPYPEANSRRGGSSQVNDQTNEDKPGNHGSYESEKSVSVKINEYFEVKVPYALLSNRRIPLNQDVRKKRDISGVILSQLTLSKVPENQS
jgi:hypothetical protein